MSHSKRTLDIRKPYSGLSRSLVIAIDVGTTFSGVSYAILEPGEIPKIHGVTRFPGQEHVAGNSKIPSVIYYDKYGRVMAAGAEAENTSFQAQAEDEGWIKAELFKLRLRPRTMQLNMNGMRLSPLPKRKTPTHVFGDFLSYLYRCTRSFISDTHANGQSLFTSVEHDIQFVLSHPNGWEGPQQTRMRAAAVYAGFVPDTDKGRARIWFVTEGEASLHACVLSGLASEVLSNPSKHGFLIADAGGGTLDISAYAVKGTSPLTIEEIAPPDCIFAGSVFVSRRAREFLEEKLKNSKYGTPDSLDHITRKFDETTKRLFRDRNELQFILFGSPLDKDAAVGIRSGQLRLTGNEVANLFEPSVDAAVNAIKRQVEASRGLIKSVFLVGGYAASPWLFQQLQERLRPYSITVSRPDTQTSKAVADGAIGFYCDHHVSARMSRFMYGVEFLREMDPTDPDHVSRRERLCELPSGPKLLPDAFDCILARGVKVKESTVFTRKYCTELTNLSMLSVFEVEIWCFRGGNDIPKWINRHDDKFSTLCVVQADLSLLNGSAEAKAGTNGKKYWTIVFSVEIHFGLTEFKARIKWMDNGQVKYGPAVIVYNERGHRIEDEDLDSYPEDDTQSYQTSRRGGGVGANSTPPASRPRTPVNPYYPSNPIAGSGSSGHRTSTVSTTGGVERTTANSNTSKPPPYASPVAPSLSGRSMSGATGYSDSERSKRGKERDGYGAYEDSQRERDRSSVYTATPTLDRARSGSGGGGPGSIYGAASPVSRRGSGAGGAGSVYSPSVRPPQSRSVSFHDGEAGGGGGEYPPPPLPTGGSPASQAWGAGGGGSIGGGTPKSAVDEHRQSHMWGDNASNINYNNNNNASPSQHHQSPGSAQLDAILDRPRSPFPASPSAHGGGVEKSPFGQQSAMYDFGGGGGHNNNLNDRPKSAFGEVPPPLTFGDGGPAALAGSRGGGGGGVGGGGGGLFGDPPASVFGETASPVVGGGGGETNNNPPDGWGYEPPPVTPVSVSSGKKGKKKTSSAMGTPASGSGGGLTPKSNSPSAFGTKQPDDAGAGGGFWGATTTSSKAPSPYDKGKPLSPLNPASHMNNDSVGGGWGGGGGDFGEGGGGGGGGGDSWGFESNNANGNGNGHDWGFGGGGGAADLQAGNGAAPPAWGEVSLNEPQKVPSRAPSPVPPPPPPETPVDEPEVGKGGKKKKTTGLAAAKKKREEEERKKNEEEEERRRKEEEEEKKRKEEDERLEEEKRKAEEARMQQEAEEQLRVQKEAEEKRIKEEQEAEQKRKEAEAEVKAARRTSIFDSTTSFLTGAVETVSAGLAPLSSNTGGGDDSWNSWGTFGGSKKKGGKGAANTTAQPSAFGGGGGGGFGSSTWGFSSFGDTNGAGDSSSLNPVESQTTPALDFSSNSPANGLFDFGSSTVPNLDFGSSASPIDFGLGSGGGGGNQPSRGASPKPPPADLVDEPLNAQTPNVETGEGAAKEDGEDGAEGAGDGGAAIADEDFGFNKKKKGKKGKKADDTPEAPPPEAAAPPADADDGFAAPTAGKKKKKKK